jgi:hypothetical protein
MTTKTTSLLLLIRCRRPPMPHYILYLLLQLIAIPSLVSSFLPIVHRPSAHLQSPLLVSQQFRSPQAQAPRQQQQQQHQLERTCLKMSSNSASPHPKSQDKHVETILFVECGTFMRVLLNLLNMMIHWMQSDRVCLASIY